MHFTAVLSQNRDREIGKVFAEHKDKLLIVDGEIRKEHVYSIPETEVDLYRHSISNPASSNFEVNLSNS